MSSVLPTDFPCLRCRRGSAARRERPPGTVLSRGREGQPRSTPRLRPTAIPAMAMRAVVDNATRARAQEYRWRTHGLPPKSIAGSRSTSGSPARAFETLTSRSTSRLGRATAGRNCRLRLPTRRPCAATVPRPAAGPRRRRSRQRQPLGPPAPDAAETGVPGSELVGEPPARAHDRDGTDVVCMAGPPCAQLGRPELLVAGRRGSSNSRPEAACVREPAFRAPGSLNPSCYADPPMSSEPTGVPAHRSPDGTWRVVRNPPPQQPAERPVALARAPREPCRRRAPSRRLRAPAGRAGLPEHHGRSTGERERHDSASQAARDHRTLAGTAEGADHARPRRNPVPGHPVVVVRRAPVRSEADREGRRAGDLPEVPAVPVGGQLPETPGSDEGGEEDLTGRPPGALAAVAPGGAEIVHRVGTGEGPRLRDRPRLRCRGTDRACGDDDGDRSSRFRRNRLPSACCARCGRERSTSPRLLPSAEKRAPDVGKKLDRLAARQGWYTFMAGCGLRQ